jgi:hypothetical protein
MQGRQKARKGQRRTAKANEDRKAGRSMPERENNKQNTEKQKPEQKLTTKEQTNKRKNHPKSRKPDPTLREDLPLVFQGQKGCARNLRTRLDGNSTLSGCFSLFRVPIYGVGKQAAFRGREREPARCRKQGPWIVTLCCRLRHCSRQDGALRLLTEAISGP